MSRPERQAPSTPRSTPKSATFAAIRHALARDRKVPVGRDLVPLLYEGNAPVPPSWLVSAAGSHGLLRLSSGAAEVKNAAVAVLDDVQGPDGSDATHRMDDRWMAANREALRQAYGALRPEGLLVFRAKVGGHASTGHAESRKRLPVDLVSTLLFEAGFIEPRFLQTGPGSWDFLALRDKREPPARRRQLLSVVMPVYNELATFRKVINSLLAKTIDGVDIEIVIVDNNSTDGTRDEVLEYIDHPRVTVALEDHPQGKGHAVRAGFRRARGDYILIQDADLEYSLDDYEALLAPLRAAETSFVLGRRSGISGVRGMRHFEGHESLSSILNLGHTIFLTIFNLTYGQRLRDPFTMFKVFRRDCISGMTFRSDRFDFDWELVAKLIRVGYLPIEIPVSYHSRSFAEGKKIRMFRDPPSWVVASLRYRFSRIFEEMPAPYGRDVPAEVF